MVFKREGRARINPAPILVIRDVFIEIAGETYLVSCEGYGLDLPVAQRAGVASRDWSDHESESLGVSNSLCDGSPGCLGVNDKHDSRRKLLRGESGINLVEQNDVPIADIALHTLGAFAVIVVIIAEPNVNVIDI